jgi:hypothetical protein
VLQPERGSSLRLILIIAALVTVATIIGLVVILQ